MIQYDLEAVIITFLEVRDEKPFFMKRKFKDEARAKAFIKDLFVSSRNVANIQFKTNHNVRWVS